MAVRPNHLLAIIGTIMLVSAAVGALYIEEKPAARVVKKEKTFSVTFPVTTSANQATGNVNDAGTEEASVQVADANVTIALVMVTWQDNQPFLRPAADVSVMVKDPAGNTVGEGRSSDGATGINVPVGGLTEVPEDLNITARSLEDAQSWVEENYPPYTNSTGDWTVTISVERGGFSGPFRRGSIDYTITIDDTFYTAEIKEVAD